MSKAWLTETENLIQSIEREVEVLTEEHTRLSKELSTKTDELAHWRAVVDSYNKRKIKEAPQPSLFLQDADSHKGLSHREIILFVRDQNNGNIPMNQVIQVLKGKVVNPDHAAGAAYSCLGRLIKQGKVSKIRPGLYRWVNGEWNWGQPETEFPGGEEVVPDTNNSNPAA